MQAFGVQSSLGPTVVLAEERSCRPNTTKFQLHLQLFASATLLKTVPGFQYVLNIITIADSADANADGTLRTRTQNFRIRTSLASCTIT